MTLAEMAERLLAVNAELDPKVREWLHVVNKGGEAADLLMNLVVHLFAEKQFLEAVKGDLVNELLTWDELFRLKMIGKPVWSAKKREWMLIIDSALDNRSWIDLVDASGKQFRMEPHDLEKYQLYRKERK